MLKLKKKKKKNTVLESPMELIKCVHVQELRSKIPKEKGGGEGSPEKCIILKTSFLVVPSNGGKEGRKTEKEGGRERRRKEGRTQINMCYTPTVRPISPP